MKDHKLMKNALEKNMVVFCWGDDNNNEENIKFLTKIGMHGIIYDK